MNIKKPLPAPCRKCGTPIHSFPSDEVREKFGLVCENCRRAKMRRYQDRARQTIHYKIRAKLASSRQNAGRRGLEFALTVNDMVEMWDRQEAICPYTGWKMVLTDSKHWNPLLGSIDRIDNSKAHTLDNVCWCCYQANLAKSQWGIHQLRALCRSVTATLERKLHLSN